MFEHERAVRPGMAGLVVLCFLMPFVKVTCGGQPIASMSGFDLAIGKKVEPPSMMGDQFGNQFGGQMRASFGDPNQPNSTDTTQQVYSFEETTPGDTAYANAMASQDQNSGSIKSEESSLGGEPTAIAAIVLAIVALFAAFGASRKTMLVSAITAGLAAVALFIMKVRFTGEMPIEAADVIVIEWTAAFWIATIGSAVLAAFTAKVLADNPPERQRPRLVIQSYSDNRPVQPPHR
jgi:hypothetical protein